MSKPAAPPAIPSDLPSAHFPDQASSVIRQAIEKAGWSFSCEGVELTSEEVSAKDGLLPLLMWVSGQTLSRIWGPQELVFRCESEALCGVVPDLRRAILPTSIWLHAMHFELEQAAQQTPSGPAVIDSWFHAWNNALSQKKVLLLPPSARAPTAAG